MATERFANSAQTSLAAPISDSDTPITVVSNANFPSQPQFRVRVGDELMLVTAGTAGTSWAVTRGYEGTAAAAHAGGTPVTQVLTAGALGNLLPDQAGNAGKFLTTDGSDPSWAAVSAGPTGPAGGDLAGTYPNPAIASDAVTDAKLRNSGALSVIGRSANSTGDPADIAANNDGDVLRRSGTTLGFGSIPSTSVTGLGALATLSSVDLSGSQATGTLAAGRFPALTGDVTTTAGSLATTIGAGKVTNSMLAGSIDLTSKVTGTLPIANGGTGQTSANAALNALLPSQTSNSGKVLQTDGSNTSWATVSAAASQDSIIAAVPGGKLTLATGVPTTTADVTGASTVYYTPFADNRIGVYDGSQWNFKTFTERSLSLSGLTSSKNYDVFLYDNSGTLTLELGAAWTSDTTRSAALTTQDGILVKSGATTRRYLGTIRTTSTTTTEDSFGVRGLFNYYWPDLWKPTCNQSRLYYAGWSASQATTSGGCFGDGSDGAVTFDGSTTVLGLVPSGNVYTLTKNLFLTNATVNASVTVKPNGFLIYGTGTLTNNGTIHDNGGNGTAATSGAAGAGGTGAAGNNTSVWGVAASAPPDGANGQRKTGSSTGNGVTSSASSTLGVSPSIGGSSGSSGSATTATAGTGNGVAATTQTAPTTAIGYPRSVPAALSGITGAIGWRAGGASGPSGGVSCNTAGNVAGSGGGGGAGGFVGIAFANIINNGTISANGGNAGNSFASVTSGQSAAGPSAGGGGGLVIVVYGNFTGNTPTATGGVAGTGATAGGGTVGSATNGSDGTVITIKT